jgi:hypothetical protein
MEIDRNAPAVKGDVEDLRGEVEDFRVEVNTRFQQFEHRMEQLLHDMEGRIITSTYRVAESLQARLTEEERESASLKTRMGIMETRLLEIEKRLNTPKNGQ